LKVFKGGPDELGFTERQVPGRVKVGIFLAPKRGEGCPSLGNLVKHDEVPGESGN